ncbi:hypothetical protein [Sulfolobus super-elliptical virus]|nr:hypothetical protein [Sulfolobus super-elliptical virus]
MNNNTETNTQTNKLKNETNKKAFTTVNSKQKFTTEQISNDFELNIPFAIRINEKYYKLYKKFNARQKRLVKYLVEAVIMAVAEGKGQIEFSETQPTIINLNANINEARAEANVNIDISKLVDTINQLQKLLLEIQKNNFNAKQNAYIIPPARINDIQEKLDSLKKLVN